MHLQSVPELRIDPSPIGPQIISRRRKTEDLLPNCWLAPEYDALKLHNEMTMLLNGRGGHLEQTYLYLDPSSAAAWYAIASQEVNTLARMLMPIDQLAEVISDEAGAVGLDLIGLGCGDSKDEVRLCQSLLERHSNRNLRRTCSISVSHCSVRPIDMLPRRAWRISCGDCLCHPGQLSQLAALHAASAPT